MFSQRHINVHVVSFKNFRKVNQFVLSFIEFKTTARNESGNIRSDPTQPGVKVEFGSSYLDFENPTLGRVEYR